MCSNFIKLKETKNGMLLFLPKCNNYQLSFNNLHFCLTTLELETFKEYLEKIDIRYWEKEYEHSVYSKKIPIPTVQKNFIILINRLELLELQSLMDFNNERSDFIRYNDFEPNYNLN